MKSRWIIASLMVVMVLAASGLQAAKEAEKKPFKATCPVSNKPASEDHVVELRNGSKIYFCCDNCPKAFKADRKKYQPAVNRQLVETGQAVQVACPISGKPCSKDHMVEAGTAKIGVCCKNCEAKYKEASDEEKLKLLFAGKAFAQGFTRQTMCPVSGKPINPEQSVEYKGKKVYFCCPNCPAAFEKDPAKYADKLPQLKEKPAAQKRKKAA